MASANLIGWCEFKINSVLICKGEVQMGRTITTVENRVNHGTSTLIDDIAVTGIDEDFKITVKEFTPAILKVWFGVPQATDISNTTAMPTNYPQYANCSVDVYHMKNSAVPFLKRTGFNCMAIPDGTLDATKQQYTSAVLRIVVLDTVGSIQNTQLAG